MSDPIGSDEEIALRRLLVGYPEQVERAVARLREYRAHTTNPTPRQEHEIHFEPRPWCWYCRRVLR